MKITFLGATETVTGSRFLVEERATRLLVDCGLFQGLKALRLRNWEAFPVPPDSLAAVALTHAHIDHTGYLPRLINQGFGGPVYATAATRALSGILLPDSGHLQEEEARYANKRGYSKHHPALPLYTAEDGERAIERFEAVGYDTPMKVGPLEVSFLPAGHILGASCVRVSDGRRSVIFTGDVGRSNDPVMRPPRPLPETDYLVVESTYGNRRHPVRDPEQELVEVVRRTAERGGVLVIPSFAVGRAQSILYLLHRAKLAGAIPDVPVYLNSPMAISATKILCDFGSEHRLTEEECDALEEGVTYVHSVEESKALNAASGPMIVISASGMATGGRVTHHIKAFAPDPANTILFAGFQAAGTRGETMLAGADSVKIHGEYVPIRAEVVGMDSLSAHADYRDLLEWLGRAPAPPKKTFIVHGEPSAQDAFRRHLADFLGWEAEIPAYLDTVELK